MTPALVTAPASLPVDLAAMKAHLRVDHDDDDALIDSMQAGAVALLDGWGGLLNRCIMPQVWEVRLKGPGPHVLPFPDASDISAELDGDAIDVIASQYMHTPEPMILLVGVSGGDEVTVTAEYGLPEERLPAAQALIKLIVGNWYENRESVVIGTISSELPMAANALISALRWWRI